MARNFRGIDKFGRNFQNCAGIVAKPDLEIMAGISEKIIPQV